MHSPVIVIIDSIEFDVELQLKNMLSPYDYNLYKIETKQYIVDKTVMSSTCSHHKVNSAKDLLLILQKEDPEDEFGIDDKGIWQKTDYNLKGEWDYWIVGGRFEELFKKCKNSCLNLPSELEPFVCEVRYIPSTIITTGVVLTSDGTWHDSNNFGLSNYPEQISKEQWSRGEENWREFLRLTFDQNDNKYGVIVDCHS